MKPNERVSVSLYPHAGSFCDGVCVVANGKFRRVDESGRAEVNAEHIRKAFTEAEGTLRSELAEAKRQWGRLEDTWLELAEQHAALKKKQAAEITEAEADARADERDQCAKALRRCITPLMERCQEIPGGMVYTSVVAETLSKAEIALRKPPAEHEVPGWLTWNEELNRRHRAEAGVREGIQRRVYSCLVDTFDYSPVNARNLADVLTREEG